jgi:hypothetical protein
MSECMVKHKLLEKTLVLVFEIDPPLSLSLCIYIVLVWIFLCACRSFIPLICLVKLVLYTMFIL